MTERPLRIAWLGPAPGGYSGVRGVAAELLLGLSGLGHEIDCFLPAAEGQGVVNVAGNEQISFGEGNLSFGEGVRFVWGTSRWEWNRWYSRNRVMAFASGIVARGVASLRLRREVMRRHRERPYDLVYQFSSIETPALPGRLARSVPLVIHPETHIAGELRWLLAERHLALRCQPRAVFAAVAAMLITRSRLQRRSIGRAGLLVCISSVFRDHLVRDYGFPIERTVVVPNPMRAERFAVGQRPLGQPPTVLVLGRISVRKGLDDALALARLLLERDVPVRMRIVGGPTLWSDYTKLLDELPENVEYLGLLSAAEVTAELARCDVLLQPAKYEPFGLTVAEALAAGLPVVATSEVGAIEGVDPTVGAVAAPGDVAAMADALARILAELSRDPAGVRAVARREAERLYAPEMVCERISAALQALVGEPEPEAGRQSEHAAAAT